MFMKKKLMCLVCLIFILVSCSDEEFTTMDSSSDSVDKGMKAAVVPQASKYNVLGWGYDVTGEYMSKDSKTVPIIDIEKLEKYSGSRIVIDDQTETTHEFFYGATSQDLMKEISSNVSKSMNANAAHKYLFKDLTTFSGTLSSHNKSDSSSYSYSTKYSFGYQSQTHEVMTYKINSYTDTLINYLTEDFTNDLKTRSPQFIVARYGTHVLTNITIGGRLYSSFSSSFEKEHNYTKKTEYTKSSFNLSLSKLGITTDTYNHSEAVATDKESKNKHIRVRTSGGNKAIDISFNFDYDNVKPIDTKEWQNSLNNDNLKNLALVKIDWNYAYPIYELVKDPVKKAALKKAVEEYIINSYKSLLDITPLYIFYNGSDKKKGFNHFTTIDPEIDRLYKNWDYHGVTGYVLKENLPGTIPLYIFYHEKGFNHFTTTDSSVGSYSGWTPLGRAGYIYKNKQEGTVALYQYYHNAGFNHFVTTDPYIIRDNSGWAHGNALGYVYPR